MKSSVFFRHDFVVEEVFLVGIWVVLKLQQLSGTQASSAGRVRRRLSAVPSLASLYFVIVK